MSLFDSIHSLFESDQPVTIESNTLNKISIGSKRSISDYKHQTSVIDLLEESYEDFVAAMLPVVRDSMKRNKAVTDETLLRDEAFWNSMYDYISTNSGSTEDTAQIVDQFIQGEGKSNFKFNNQQQPIKSNQSQVQAKPTQQTPTKVIPQTPTQIGQQSLREEDDWEIVDSSNYSYSGSKYAGDVTTEELNNHPVYFNVFSKDPSGYGTEHSRRKFDNKNALFNEIRNAYGGFNVFDNWSISSAYEDGEFYLVRNRYAKGGWQWEDVNGSVVEHAWRDVGSKRRSQKDTSNLEESEQLFNSLPDPDRRIALINSTLSDESDAIEKWQTLIDSGLFTDEEVEHMKKDQQEEREHIDTLKSFLIPNSKTIEEADDISKPLITKLWVMSGGSMDRAMYIEHKRIKARVEGRKTTKLVHQQFNNQAYTVNELEQALAKYDYSTIDLNQIVKEFNDTQIDNHGLFGQ